MGLVKTSLIGLAASALMAGSALAADLPQTPMVPDTMAFNWDGLYIGAQAGGTIAGGTLYGNLGVVVGANATVADGILGGVELQANGYFNGGFAAYDLLALGRIGALVADNALLYADLGAGIVNGTPAYAFGGGIEFAVADNVSLRGDIQGLGAIGAAPSAARATVGVLFHMN